MALGEVVALGAMLLSIFGAIGAVIRWASIQFREQRSKLEKLDKDYRDLHREHSLVLVKLERTRLAFQMVATELARKSPGNAALSLAKSLLDEAFRIDADIPADMLEQLERLT